MISTNYFFPIDVNTDGKLKISNWTSEGIPYTIVNKRYQECQHSKDWDKNKKKKQKEARVGILLLDDSSQNHVRRKALAKTKTI